MTNVAAADKENVPPKVKFHGVIHVNGFTYHKKWEGKKYTTYWCANKRNMGCCAKVNVMMNGEIKIVEEEHSEGCRMKVKGARKVLSEIELGGDEDFEEKKRKKDKIDDYSEFMLQRAQEIAVD